MPFSNYFNRKDRPLPQKGCSIAFYIMLVGMVIALIVIFIKYKTLL